jgi:excisionase family DNA binding protein
MSTIIENITPDELQARIEMAVSKAISAIPEKQKEAFLTRDQASKQLHVTKNTLDKYINNGALTAVRLGNRVSLPESEIKLNRVKPRNPKQ